MVFIARLYMDGQKIWLCANQLKCNLFSNTRQLICIIRVRRSARTKMSSCECVYEWVNYFHASVFCWPWSFSPFQNPETESPSLC